MESNIRVLKFDLSGDFATFKKPDVNVDIGFTYSQIHKIALFGLLGCCLGFGGYLEQEDEIFPEFYARLKDLKLAIVPRNKNAYIDKVIHSFNNSTGHASKEEGGNLIVKEQLLVNPSWTIYIKLDNDELSKNLERTFTNFEFTYIPYLGKNDFLADIYNVEVLELNKLEEDTVINSIFMAKDFEVINTSSIRRRKNTGEAKTEYFCSENLPIALNESNNHYILEKFNATNKPIKSLNLNNHIYKDFKNDLTLTFI